MRHSIIKTKVRMNEHDYLCIQDISEYDTRQNKQTLVQNIGSKCIMGKIYRDNHFVIYHF